MGRKKQKHKKRNKNLKKRKKIKQENKNKRRKWEKKQEKVMQLRTKVITEGSHTDEKDHVAEVKIHAA